MGLTFVERDKVDDGQYIFKAVEPLASFTALSTHIHNDKVHALVVERHLCDACSLLSRV